MLKRTALTSVIFGALFLLFPSRVQAANLDFLTVLYEQPSATLPLDRVIHHEFTVTNTSDQPREINFSIYVSETDQEIVGWPQPQVLFLAPGETEMVQTFLDENWGQIDKNSFGTQNRTVEWRFVENSSGESRTETITYGVEVLDQNNITGPFEISGTVINHEGVVVPNASVELTTGNWATTTTSLSDGTFSFSGVPVRSDWWLVARVSERNSANSPAGSEHNCPPPPAPCNPPNDLQSLLLPAKNAWAHDTVAGLIGIGYAYVDPTVKNYTIELMSPTHTASFQVAKTISSEIGFWKGDVDQDEQYALLINGMENWAGQDKTTSKLYFYSIDGDLLWTYDMGWEGWGVDLSADGMYAAFTTSNPTGVFGLIDAKTGTAIWTKNSSDYNLSLRSPGPNGGLDSKEVAISSTNKYFAIGHGGGNLVVADLLTGEFLWTADLYGQVRGILFDQTDHYVYVGSGDGRAYKLDAATGAIVWQADIGAWPFVEAFTLSADGKYLATGSKVGQVTVINTETGQKLWQQHQGGTASWVDFSPNGEYLFAGGGGQYASTLYDVSTGDRLWTLGQYSHQGKFSATGDYILVGDKDVKVVDLYGNILTTILPTETEGAQIGQGQFAYITQDGSRVLFSRRDISAGAVSLIFAQGSIAESPHEEATPTPGENQIARDNDVLFIGGGFIFAVIFTFVLVTYVTRRKKNQGSGDDAKAKDTKITPKRLKTKDEETTATPSLIEKLGSSKTASTTTQKTETKTTPQKIRAKTTKTASSPTKTIMSNPTKSEGKSLNPPAIKTTVPKKVTGKKAPSKKFITGK